MSEYIIQDYEQYEREKEKWLASRPICAVCGEPIQDDSAYRINGELWCNDCIEDCEEWIED